MLPGWLHGVCDPGRRLRVHFESVKAEIVDVATIDPDVLPFYRTRISGFRRDGEYGDFHIGKLWLGASITPTSTEVEH